MLSIIDAFFNFILGFGLIGIFILSAVDSTIFFFLPFANDAVLIILVAHHRQLMLLYVLLMVAGSITGSALTYVIVSGASKETLMKMLPRERVKKVQKKLADREFGGMLAASLMPPPFPYTAFVTAAALARRPQKRTLAAVSVGRVIRYSTEGILAYIFGSQLLKVFQSTAFKAIMFGLFVVAAIGTAISIYRWLSHR